jgi:hypothetical protein
MDNPDFLSLSRLQGGTREESRESIFLGAQVQYAGESAAQPARVRNISAGGMMIDTAKPHPKGQLVTVTLKSIGEVSGKVAWSTATRIGIAFDEQIDPLVARTPVTAAPVEAPFKQPYIPDRRPGLAIR